MRPRRGGTDLAGIVLVDKPAGLTSHDVVNRLRTATGERRIGHAGTLDPLATGLLVVLIGRATRLEQYLVGHDKRYEARIAFGTATDTLDAEGAVTAQMPVPETVFDPGAAEALLRSFLGPHQQMPPVYSAIKRGGVSAHRLARAGAEVELEARPISVHSAALRRIDADAATWDVDFEVSKGTYVRSLARDIGVAAGTVAHLSALRRTRSGSAELSEAVSLETAVEAAGAGRLHEIMRDPVALLGFPLVDASAHDTRDGRSLQADGSDSAEGERVAVATPSELLGVYRRSGSLLVPETVLIPGVAR